MKIITFCIALLISSATFAGITIKQISTLRKMVIATDSEKKSSVKKGSEFVATFQDNTQCTMEVVKVRGKKIFLDAGLCKVDLLRKGQTLQASAFDNEDGQITSKHMADSSGSLLTSETGKATGKRIADSHLEEFKNNTNRQESWYTMWNYAPLTSVSAGEDIERKFKSNTTFFGLDVLGFYWPMFTKGLIVGGVFNYYNYSDEAKEFSFSILEAQNYNTSALYFLGGEIGRGFFVRGDLGVRLARFEYAPKVTTIEGVTSLGPPVEKDDVGLNAALGFGRKYACFPERYDFCSRSSTVQTWEVILMHRPYSFLLVCCCDGLIESFFFHRIMPFFLIYQVLGITTKEGHMIDMYQNKQ